MIYVIVKRKKESKIKLDGTKMIQKEGIIIPYNPFKKKKGSKDSSSLFHSLPHSHIPGGLVLRVKCMHAPFRSNFDCTYSTPTNEGSF